MSAEPRADQKPQVSTHHRDRLSDEYDWLRNHDAEVVQHLEDENRWCADQTGHLSGLVDELCTEADRRSAEIDLSVPHQVHHWLRGQLRTYWYYLRTLEGRPYPVYSRLAVGLGPPPDPWGGQDSEEVLLDGNAEAGDEVYFALGMVKVSPDGRLLAWGEDRSGDEKYRLRVRDLATGMSVDTPIDAVSAQLAWCGNHHLFYVRRDEASRPYQIWRHRLGTDPHWDVLIVTEDDPEFRVTLRESRDREWLLITIGSKSTNETWILSTDEPEGEFRSVALRRPGARYQVEVAGDRLLIVHTDNHPDGELAEAPLECTRPDQWSTVLAHADGTRLIRADAYEKFIVVSLRRNSLPAIHVIPRSIIGTLGAGEDVMFDDPVYSVTALPGPNFSDEEFRLSYSSMVTPPTMYQMSVMSRRLSTLKQMRILDDPDWGGYRSSDYVQYREWAVASDGAKIPISIVARKGTPRDGTAPGLLYGYGAYGFPIDAEFDVMRISLLDRGAVFAIAHVRGGGELGREWHRDGKREHKPNSFTDFVACAHHLIEQGFVAADRLAGQGSSAGGLLIGAALNLEPELFRAAQLDVPFVDPLTTGLDPKLPLTVTEWQEWGDPLHDRAAYELIKSYSPYENVQAARYPAILATASLNDARVDCAEAAKWVARLREQSTSDPARPILLHTDMDAGHAGVTGREDLFRAQAFRLAFLLDQLDVSAGPIKPPQPPPAA